MFNFLEILRKPKSTTEEVKAAIEKTESKLAIALKNIETLNADRAEVMLSGSDSAMEKHDQNLAESTRSVEQLELGTAALRERLIECEAKDSKAALDRKVELAEKCADDCVGKIQRFGELARELREILVELAAEAEVVRLTNADLAEADDSRRVKTSNEICRKVPDEITPAHVQMIKIKGLGDRSNGGEPRFQNGPPEPREVNVPENRVLGVVRPPLYSRVQLPREDYEEGNYWGNINFTRDMKIEREQKISARVEELLSKLN